MTERRPRYRTACQEWACSQAESDWQESLIGPRGHATMRGWHAYHVPDSRRIQGAGADGFPDLVLARVLGGEHVMFPRVIYVELKTESGQVSDDQRWWLDVLTASGAEVFVWRPSDLAEVERILDAPLCVDSHTEWQRVRDRAIAVLQGASAR